jgi:superfamily II helicase
LWLFYLPPEKGDRLMGSGRTWTEYEIEYLKEYWGLSPLKDISKELNRTKIAVHLKAKREKLGAVTQANEYITPNHIAKLLKADSHIIIRWIKKHNLKAEKKVMVFKREFYLIKYCDLCRWLEKNQDRFDSRKIELFALGYEPRWLKEKRARDNRLPKNRFKKWTKFDVQRIMIYSKDMAYIKIAQIMDRSYDSIDRKLFKLRKAEQ